MTSARIVTIGHSNHPLERFLALLSRHGITAVADVRSAPYSHARTMDRLLAEVSPNLELFQTREALLTRAMALQARRVAFITKLQ